MIDHYKRILVFLKAKNKKNFLKILKELSVLLVLKKEFPFYYFAKYLFKKEVTNYKDYLGTRETSKIINTFKPEPRIVALIDNKYDFGAHLEKNNISSPEILGHNINGQFFIKADSTILNDEKELVLFFKKVFKTFQKDKIFVKPISGGQGTNCHIFYENSISQKIEELAPQLFSGSFLFQTVIPQHEKINAINPSSINTLRIDSYINSSGNPVLLNAFMRFGIKGSVQDNASKGGFCVPIDISKGTLGKQGQQLMKYGGRVFLQHPDTSHSFENFEVPFFEEACTLVKKACNCVDSRLLGWDIAIAPTGPMIIETNNNLGLFISDKMYGGLKKHPFFKEIEFQVS